MSRPGDVYLYNGGYRDITGAGSALGLTSGGSGNCCAGGRTYFQPVTEPLNLCGLSVY